MRVAARLERKETYKERLSGKKTVRLEVKIKKDKT